MESTIKILLPKDAILSFMFSSLFLILISKSLPSLQSLQNHFLNVKRFLQSCYGKIIYGLFVKIILGHKEVWSRFIYLVMALLILRDGIKTRD